ncbi:MAG TPA: inositol monophosphatase [Bacteroidales bacterium]|nr:MAG: inositol monophosphatase [Bacteroidetes bacterium GWE2_42_24]OFY31364.1 MAG: inositol monophosphatase [Bacteroidetes bacterium GWF2_43_11]PKP20896.1 MAG: inositol monophosphatase [Bacteroidetes bacterium HGW-Bacteroidetes-22]HBZ67764.1 inositol monophosphatase [Bacteroidales bacterium]
MNLQEITFQAETAARAAGDFILLHINKLKTNQIEVKGEHNYVTFVDKGAEEIIVKMLQMVVPEATFLTEEETVKSEVGEWQWIIDPLDGTTNFIHGIPLFSVSIALAHHGIPVAGVVYEINSRECFSAWKGGHALLNGNPIHVSECDDMNESLLATGFPYYDYDLLSEYLGLFGSFMKHTRGLRRFGSAAVDLAWVACGRVDGFYEYGLNPWDVAAGALIVEQAGGQVTDFKGGNDFLAGKRIVASNSSLHAAYLKTIAQYFPLDNEKC